jgi:smad nuclear-interacting protein 1
VIDLESTNGTMVNEETIPASRYYELKASDGELSSIFYLNRTNSTPPVLKFGQSTREYVLLHDSAS